MLQRYALLTSGSSQAHLLPLQISAQMLTLGRSPRWADPLPQLGYMYNDLRWLNCRLLWKETSKRQVGAMRNHYHREKDFHARGRNWIECTGELE